MKKLAISIFLSLAVVSTIAMAISATTLVISGLQGKSGDGQVVLSWNASPDRQGNPAEKYTVHYGDQSVAEGLVDSYSTSEETTQKSLTITGLKNGVPQYFAVQAIGLDGSLGPLSEEIRIVPTVGVVGPTIVNVYAETKTSVLVEFSEEVVLPERNAELAFSIVDSSNSAGFLLVWDAAYKKEGPEDNQIENKQKVLLTTDAQIKGVKYEIVVSALIKNNQGNSVVIDNGDKADFEGTDSLEPIVIESALKAASEEDNAPVDPIEAVLNDTKLAVTDAAPVEKDITPPEDITKLVISFKQRVNDFLMQLSWIASINSAGDLVDQFLYHSKDKGKVWTKPVALGKETASYEMAGQPETEHTFKITTKDQAGNESAGLIESIRLPALPSTGPLAMTLVGLGLVTAGYVGLRKKK